MLNLTVTSKDPADIGADALVVGVVSGSGGPALAATPGLSTGVRNRLATALKAAGVSAKPDAVQRIPAVTGVNAKSVVFTGLGEQSTVDDESLRRAAGAAARSLAGSAKAVLALPATTPAATVAVAEGALLGAYSFDRYKSGAKGDGPLGAAVVVTGASPAAVRGGIRRAKVLAEAVHGTRDLINTSPLDLYPAQFAAEATAAAEGLPVKVTVLDEKKLARGGYGGLIGVGQGSTRPPRLVQLEYAPRAAKKHVALIGKGITFDSGGISIKPAANMDAMKSDMSGAAAVLHTVLAAAKLELPVRVTGWLAIAENMPSGTAQRPSDVITIRGGKTVEVLNTDAEGRLVLADALVSAGENGANPDVIVDIATLTGAQMVALGNRISAIMANDDDLRDQVRRAADTSGEQFWPMPLPKELRASMDSKVADIANIGDRFGGMLVAGLFLQDFVPTDGDGRQVPWAHLDIAGPAFLTGAAHGYTTVGGTGVGVRTMLTLLEDLA
ncbi:leucyl aminopeptidase [Spongisporangium articulatum]|uniref:Probable cytosol aminopeptidase n=1 Tax=Spongisporangium articulatum TaxID=3362603 RepID=A0ABW8AV56_9ACTN